MSKRSSSAKKVPPVGEWRAQGYSEDDSKLIVKELAKLSRQFGVDREHLPDEAFQIVKDDSNHPLRPFVMRELTQEQAADRYWLSSFRQLVRCVKWYDLELPPL